MVLCEVEEYIETLCGALPEQSFRYREATEKAIQCIEAQMRLEDILNDINQIKINDTFSSAEVREILEECRYDWEEEIYDGE